MNQNGGVRLGRQFWQVLTSPGKAFAKIVAEPAFLKAALVITFINLVLGVIIAPKIRAYTAWLITHGPVAPPPGQVEQAVAVASTAAAAASVASAAAMPWLVWLVVAGALKIFTALSAKGVPFKTLFALAVYGYIPVFIGSLIAGFITLCVPAENLQNISLSLAVFLPPQESFFYFFLTKCSPFTWWSLILWGTAGGVALNIRPAGVTAYLFGLWGAAALAAALLGTLKTVPGMS
jgi:hypothetical protein